MVQVVAEDAEGEDGYGKGIAAQAGVAAEELGYDFVVVFWGLLDELWNGPGAVNAGMGSGSGRYRTLLRSDATGAN